MSRKFIFYGSKSAFEPETIRFFNHADINIPLDGTLYNIGTPQQRSGINFWNYTNDAVVALKEELGLTLGMDNLETRIPLWWITIGGTALRHSVNFPQQTRFNVSFFGGWTHDGTGALPNGVNAYCTSTDNLDGQFDMRTFCVGFFSKTNADGFYLDLYGQDGARPDIFMYARNGGNIVTRLDADGVNKSDGISNSNGMLWLRGNTTTSYDIVQNTTLIATRVRGAIGPQMITNPLQRGLSGSQFPVRKHSAVMAITGQTTLANIQNITTILTALDANLNR